jgi:hypothetical protein
MTDIFSTDNSSVESNTSTVIQKSKYDEISQDATSENDTNTKAKKVDNIYLKIYKSDENAIKTNVNIDKIKDIEIRNKIKALLK